MTLQKTILTAILACFSTTLFATQEDPILSLRTSLQNLKLEALSEKCLGVFDDEQKSRSEVKNEEDKMYQGIQYEIKCDVAKKKLNELKKEGALEDFILVLNCSHHQIYTQTKFDDYANFSFFSEYEDNSKNLNGRIFKLTHIARPLSYITLPLSHYPDHSPLIVKKESIEILKKDVSKDNCSDILLKRGSMIYTIEI